MMNKLTYRLFEKSDIEGVLRLWEEESGWGGITEEQFYNWYLNTPFGECLTVLAVNQENKIVGQTVFMPAKIYLEGKEQKALRVLAPIIAKDFRNNLKRSEHPFFEMYKCGLQSAVEQGVSVFYTFPAHTWLAILQLFPRFGLHRVEMSEFDCYALRIEESNVSSDKKIDVSSVREFDEEFDELWQEALINFPIECGIIRNTEWLNWKHGAHSTFAFRDSENKLLGYFSIDKKNFLLTDALAVTQPDLEENFKALIDFLKKNGEFGISEIKLIKTNFMKSIIEADEFAKVDFKFAFGTYAVDSNISVEAIRHEKWYLMPND